MDNYFCFVSAWPEYPGEIVEADSIEEAAEEYCLMCSKIDRGVFSISVLKGATEHKTVLVKVTKKARVILEDEL